MALPKNITIGRVFNRYGDEFKSEKDLRTLSIQQRKRDFGVFAFAIFGGIAGYMLARRLNLKTWAKLSTIALGGAVFGTSVAMLTQEKYNNRSQAIDEKRQTLEQARYLTEIAQRGANKTEEKMTAETKK